MKTFWGPLVDSLVKATLISVTLTLCVAELINWLSKGVQ